MDYKNLLVYQKSLDLVTEIYQLTKKYPREEQYGLISQMRRASISIPSNIAEGRQRKSTPEFKRFLIIAYGSGAEIEAQIQISKNLDIVTQEETRSAEEKLTVVLKMLNKLLNSDKLF